jgi:hypothetical protein
MLAARVFFFAWNFKVRTSAVVQARRFNLFATLSLSIRINGLFVASGLLQR